MLVLAVPVNVVTAADVIVAVVKVVAPVTANVPAIVVSPETIKLSKPAISNVTFPDTVKSPPMVTLFATLKFVFAWNVFVLPPSVKLLATVIND